MAEALLSRRGGGGLNLKGTTWDCAVPAGITIEKGDIVSVGISTTPSTVRNIENAYLYLSNNYAFVHGTQLSETRAVIMHPSADNNRSVAVTVLDALGGEELSFTTTIISTTQIYATATPIVLENGHLLIAYTKNTGVYYMVVAVNSDRSVSVMTAETLLVMVENCPVGYGLDAVQLENGRVLIGAVTYPGTRAILVQTVEDSLTVLKDSQIIAASYAPATTLRMAKMRPGIILMLSGGENSAYSSVAIVIAYTDNDYSTGVVTTLNSNNSASCGNAVMRLDDSRALACYGSTPSLYASVLILSGTTIAIKGTTFNSGINLRNGMSVSFFPIGKNKAIRFARYDGNNYPIAINVITVNMSAASLSLSTTTNINVGTYGHSGTYAFLAKGRLFLVTYQWSGSNSANKNVKYASLPVVVGEGLALLDGLALEDGTAGGTVKVYGGKS